MKFHANSIGQTWDFNHEKVSYFMEFLDDILLLPALWHFRDTKFLSIKSHLPSPPPLPLRATFCIPPSGGRAKTSSVSVGTSPPFKIRCAVRQGGFIWGEEVVCCNEKGENTRQIGSPQWVTFKLPPDPYHITYCTHTIQTSVSSVFLLPSEKGGDKTIFLY